MKSAQPVPTAEPAEPASQDTASQDPASQDTMRAIVQHRYGTVPEEVLRLERIARPRPAAGEVLVKVQAAGVDRGTWHLMAGQPYLMRLGLGFRGPRNHVPGLDVAGTVVATGPGVTRFAVGDEVFGIARGSFAEYAVAREAKLARKPAALTFAQAAAVAVSGLTALQGLRDAGHLRAGSEGPGHRRLGRRRQLRRPARQGLRGRGHRGLRHRQDRPGPRHRRRSRHRLHARQDFADGPRALRPDPRHRRQHPAVPAAAGADAPRHARHRRRRGSQGRGSPVDRNRDGSSAPWRSRR